VVNKSTHTFRRVSHIQRDHDRNSKLYQLSCEVEIALYIGCINYVNNDIWLIDNDGISGNYLFNGISGKRVRPRQIQELDTVAIKLIGSLPFFDGYSRIIADMLICTGQVVENSGFSGIGIAGECNNEIFLIRLPPLLS